MSSTGALSRSYATREATITTTMTSPPMATAPGPLDRVRTLPSLTGLRWATAMLIFGHHLTAVNYISGNAGFASGTVGRRTLVHGRYGGS